MPTWERAGTLPPALAGERFAIAGRAGGLACYLAGAAHEQRPLLLLHSVNAAAGGHEMRPLFGHYAALRPVYAPDLPGFGHSERSDRPYDPRLMTDAVHVVVAEIRRRHGPRPIDALALSLSSEFLARAATERPDTFRSLALISPTGFGSADQRNGPDGTTLARPFLYRTLRLPFWERTLFGLLTGRPSIRFFLRKAWGGAPIDEEMAEYCCRTARVPGARFAPLRFLGGYLFSADIGRVYDRLTLPVWLAHGVRGDFTDYGAKARFADRPNWRFEVFQTGALPHFETGAAFLARYDAFLAGIDAVSI